MGRSTNALTPHQAALLEMICREDLTNAEAAQRLGLSVNTVKVHLSNAFKTLGLTSSRGACYQTGRNVRAAAKARRVKR